MGSNGFADGFGNDPSDASPNHQVFISSFYMGKTEVTYTQYTNVRTWATSHGYAIINAGSGKATNHPVQMVSWYDCVKWCNARSEMEGLTPCCYTNAEQTVVYRTGSVNLSNDWVKWSANGYRLPTEAEWEKAARGGAVGMRFPWADANTITNSRANYRGDTGYYAYDLGPAGYNPAFTYEPVPYTSPAGYFAPNGYGLYGIAGNVLDQCWDWYVSTYYVSSPASDPRGSVSGCMSFIHCVQIHKRFRICIYMRRLHRWLFAGIRDFLRRQVISVSASKEFPDCIHAALGLS